MKKRELNPASSIHFYKNNPESHFRIHLSAILIAFLIFSFASSCNLWERDAANRYALVIGIADYKYYSPGDYDLNFTDDDARSMEKILFDDGWEIRDLLLDDAASYASIQSAITRLFSDIEKNATVLIYYSGHGTLENLGFSGESAIVPWDFDPRSGPNLWTPLITPDTLSEWISSAASGRTSNIIVILDSCNSGGFVELSDAIDSIPDDYNPPTDSDKTSLLEMASTRFSDMLASNLRSKGVLEPIVLSAAGSLDLSWESGDFVDRQSDSESMGHGIFTYFLLQSKFSGDRNRDGFVTCSEAFSYASNQIDIAWNKGGYAKTRTDGYYLPRMTGGLRDLVLFAPGK